MKIFISSTYEDLKDERKEAIAIVDRIGQAIAMEKFFASNHQSKEVCLKRLQECDAIVLILGFKYGSIDEDERISFTEIEYNMAKTLGLPVFVFVKYQSDGSWLSDEVDTRRSDNLFRFRSRLDSEHYRVAFATPQQLAIEIVGAVRQYEKENGLLGVRLPAFASFQDFFNPFLDDTRLFHHVHPLAGRNDLLRTLHDFVESDKRIALLYGRGGIGKSKVLFEFSRRFRERHPECKLRCLREGVALTDEAIRQLPAQKCVVVVDDAHRREDLSTLFAAAQQYPDLVKIILSSRPQGLDYLRSTMTEGGFDPREVENIPELGELGRSDLEQLGRQVLGEDHLRFLESLIQVAGDSPLVIVIGGRLIAENSIDPEMLERHDEFQRAVFDRFRDVLLGEVSNRLGAELCRDILSLVAALSPIQPQSEAFQEYASDFLNVERIKLIDAISILESCGILLRRGFSLRIAPDVLSDHILYNACVTPGGQPTGYAHEIFDAFGRIFSENVLFNLSELDWRIKREGVPVDLLGQIWEAVESEFEGGSPFRRSQMLRRLRRTAYFQPARTLMLVEYAINNPSKVTGNVGQILPYSYGRKDVLYALPPLLRRVAFNLDYLPRCCDLLWYLGRDDERPTNPYPEHAMRVLLDLAGYDIGKPVQFNSAILDAIERWLNEFDAHEHVHSPLDVLDPLLGKEGYSTRSRGFSIDYRPFAVSYETTKSIREKAISILSECTKSQSTKVVLRALRSLTNALRSPHGLFGRVVSADERNQWLPEQMRILEIIENLVENTLDPVIHIQVASDLRIYARRSSQKDVAEKADSIINIIPDYFELRTTRAIWNRYDRDWPQEDYRQHQDRVNQEIERTVIEFLDRFEDEEKVFDVLNGILSHLQYCGIQAQPGYFLFMLGVVDCELSTQICRCIISNPSSPISIYLYSLLSGIREKSPSEAVDLVRSAVETENETLCYSVAHSYALGRWASTMENEELWIINTLLTYPNKAVKQHAIESLGKFPDAEKDKAVELALSTVIDDDEELADTLCGIFHPRYGIPPDRLRDEDLKNILSKLIGIKELSDRLYHVYRFLRYCSSRIPEDAVDFLLKRIDITEEKISDGEYHPLPYLGFRDVLKEVSSSSNYEKILREVRDRALSPKAIDDFWLPKLFADISGDFCPICLRVLYEWIDSGDAKKIQAVGLLVRDAPPEFVFSHSEFVSTLLEKSYIASEDCYRNATTSLLSSAYSKGARGTVGKPMPRDVKIRDQAKILSQKIPAGSPTQRFYFELMRHAEALIRQSLIRDQEIFE